MWWNCGNDRVERFSGSGTYKAQFGSAGSGDGQFNDPQGVAVSLSTGDVYVADAGNHRVEEFNSNGGYIGQFGTQGTGNGQFEDPTGLASIPQAAMCM